MRTCCARLQSGTGCEGHYRAASECRCGACCGTGSLQLHVPPHLRQQWHPLQSRAHLRQLVVPLC